MCLLALLVTVGGLGGVTFVLVLGFTRAPVVTAVVLVAAPLVVELLRRQRAASIRAHSPDDEPDEPDEQS